MKLILIPRKDKITPSSLTPLIHVLTYGNNKKVELDTADFYNLILLQHLVTKGKHTEKDVLCYPWLALLPVLSNLLEVKEHKKKTFKNPKEEIALDILMSWKKILDNPELCQSLITGKYQLLQVRPSSTYEKNSYKKINFSSLFLDEHQIESIDFKTLYAQTLELIKISSKEARKYQHSLARRTHDDQAYYPMPGVIDYSSCKENLKLLNTFTLPNLNFKWNMVKAKDDSLLAWCTPTSNLVFFLNELNNLPETTKQVAPWKEKCLSSLNQVKDKKNVSFQEMQDLLMTIKKLRTYKFSIPHEQQLVEQLAYLFTEQYLAHSNAVLLFSEICYVLYEKKLLKIPVKYAITTTASKEGCLLFPNFESVTKETLVLLEETIKHHYVFNSSWADGCYFHEPLELNVGAGLRKFSKAVKQSNLHQGQYEKSHRERKKEPTLLTTKDFSRTKLDFPGFFKMRVDTAELSMDVRRRLFFQCINSLNIPYVPFALVSDYTYIDVEILFPVKSLLGSFSEIKAEEFYLFNEKQDVIVRIDEVVTLVARLFPESNKDVFIECMNFKQENEQFLACFPIQNIEQAEAIITEGSGTEYITLNKELSRIEFNTSKIRSNEIALSAQKIEILSAAYDDCSKIQSLRK